MKCSDDLELKLRVDDLPKGVAIMDSLTIMTQILQK